MYASKVLNQELKDEELEQIMGAKDTMLSEMGVYQHHDAIAGTAKQLVANDYANRLEKAIKNNTLVYT
jgi:hypothetical protein